MNVLVPSIVRVVLRLLSLLLVSMGLVSVDAASYISTDPDVELIITSVITFIVSDVLMGFVEEWRSKRTAEKVVDQKVDSNAIIS